MARALTMQRTVVTPGERARFLERARMLRAHYHRANCQYWVFEDAEVGGAFLEFAEAADESMLAAAQAAAPDAVGVDPTRLYREVEI